ncbi:hypothetical protein [Campylobacter felis]|uniref:hypothetical protein n=1 Tax=Campylobacter felis TaxID=2974565 RepID=UPI002568ED90|nr:hypothetical protein [uncultured Tyzzerella sp.]MDL0102659.1 hypothetical protein [Campylobacter felis]
MYNYAKYENATRKDIIKALNLAEKKEKKLQEQLKENKEKLTKETLQALKNATSIGVFNNFDEAKKALMSED